MKDYYHGYEGEPEIQFIRCLSAGGTDILRMWVGFFDAIMDLVEPSDTGWEGLALYYHLGEGWYEDSPWEIFDIDNTIEALCRLDARSLKKETQDVLNDICSMLCAARAAQERVLISYD